MNLGAGGEKRGAASSLLLLPLVHPSATSGKLASHQRHFFSPATSLILLSLPSNVQTQTHTHARARIKSKRASPPPRLVPGAFLFRGRAHRKGSSSARHTPLARALGPNIGSARAPCAQAHPGCCCCCVAAAARRRHRDATRAPPPPPSLGERPQKSHVCDVDVAAGHVPADRAPRSPAPLRRSPVRPRDGHPEPARLGARDEPLPGEDEGRPPRRRAPLSPKHRRKTNKRTNHQPQTPNHKL